MTGLDNILKEITKDSESKSKSIIADAKSEAEKIQKNAEADAEKLYNSIIAEAEKKAGVIESRAEAKAELSLKREVLKKKQMLIKEYILAAKQRLQALSGQEYFDVLEKIIKKNANGKPGEVILTKAAKENTDEKFKAFLKENSLEISESVLKGTDGVIIDYGSIEENCTFDAMFDGLMEELSDKTMALLFE